MSPPHLGHAEGNSSPALGRPPAFDQDLGLKLCVEHLTGQEFVPKRAVEALDAAVLPGRARSISTAAVAGGHHIIAIPRMPRLLELLGSVTETSVFPAGIW